MDYINKIFEIGAKNDILKEISNRLLNELTSIINIKDLILDENKNINKIDELLMNKNIEMRTYMFEIILSEFIQNKENKDNDENNNISIVEFNIMKHRAGANGKVDLLFEKNISDFRNYVKDNQPQEI
jgi:hypothetical protein